MKGFLKTLNMQNDARDETFDILKGTAIVLVILGHCRVGPLYSFIYSFHMPLFFFISGYFLKIRPLKEEMYLSTQRLIVPYIFASCCICAIALFVALCGDAGLNFFQLRVVRNLLGFRGCVTPEWIDGHVGLLWFLLAMFWARSIVVFLVNKIKSAKVIGVLCLTIGLLGIFIDVSIFVPYCISQGLSAASLIFVGYLIREFKWLDSDKMKKIVPLLILVWLYTWKNGGMSMARSWYSSGYIIDLIGSLGAFCTLFMVVKASYRANSLIWKVIRFCGRYSLVVYVVHSIEYDLINWKFFAANLRIPNEYYDVFQVSTRLCIVFLFTILILAIKPLREHVFQIKTA